MIIISHQERIIRLADEIVVIAGGQIAHRGNTEEILPLILADTLGGCPVLERQGGAAMIDRDRTPACWKRSRTSPASPWGPSTSARTCGCDGPSVHGAYRHRPPRPTASPVSTSTSRTGTKGETCHIPVIISQTGMNDMVYNDFYVGRRLRRHHRGGLRHPQLRLRREPPRRHPHLPHRQELPRALHGEALRRGRQGRDRQEHHEPPDHCLSGGELPPCRWTPSRSGASTPPCGTPSSTARPAARWW